MVNCIKPSSVFSLVFTFVLYSWSASSVVADDEAYASSLFLALQANNEALEDFDVVFVYRVMSAQSSGKSKFIERIARAVRSSERRVRLIAVQSLLEATSKEGEDSSQMRAYAAVISDEGDGTFVETFGTGSFKNEFERSMNRARWPRFDLVGLVGFPGSGSPFKKGVNEFEQFVVPGQDLTSSIVGNIAFANQSRVNEARETVSKQWKFDAKSQLPMSFTLKWENEDKSVSFDHRKHRFEWEDHEGVSCPLRVEEDILHNSKDGRFQTFYETDFKWLLVNKPIPEELTNINRYNSQQSILKFLEPARKFKESIDSDAQVSGEEN